MTESTLVRHLRDLARHMAWADDTVWKAVLAAPQSESDTRIGETLHHMHLVQHLFLQAWTSAPFSVRQRAEFPALADIAQWGSDGARSIVTFVEGVGEGELEQPFRMPWASHFEQSTNQPAAIHTLGESALQVFLHTQHHRGQVCTRLREIGGAPPTVDFIVWLWQGRPASAT